MPAVGPETRTDGDKSTPAAAATVALVTAPPQEIANSSVKTASPGTGSRCSCPKTSSRKTSPNEIMSTEQPPAAHRCPDADPAPAGLRLQGSRATLRFGHELCSVSDS